jgi:hypothetical protein
MALFELLQGHDSINHIDDPPLAFLVSEEEALQTTIPQWAWNWFNHVPPSKYEIRLPRRISYKVLLDTVSDVLRDTIQIALATSHPSTLSDETIKIIRCPLDKPEMSSVS